MVEVVCAVIFNNKSEVLIAQRHKGNLAGQWEFPGGKVEFGESYETSLKRELKEELAVEVVVLSKIHEIIVSPGNDFKLLFYLAKILSGNINLKDHQAYEWVALEHLHRYRLLDGDRAIINILKDKNY